MTNLRTDLGYFWDQHCCPSLDTSASIDAVGRYAGAGGRALCLNTGYAPHGPAETFALLEHFTALVERSTSAQLVRTVGEADAAAAAGGTAVFFDLEDTAPLGGDVGLVQTFYDRGVRSMLTTYNTRNAAGSGCLDVQDDGLTRYGKDVVQEMNRVGMQVDAAHVSRRSSLEMMELSTAPVIFSHTALRAVFDVERGIDDDQARACAQTGGVIGICGVGIFLGENEATVEAMIRHIDHLVDLVGFEAVGIGSDFSFDLAAANAELRINPQLFPERFRRYGEIRMVAPEELVGIGPALHDRGYPPAAVAAITGGNFRRVAEQVWR